MICLLSLLLATVASCDPAGHRSQPPVISVKNGSYSGIFSSRYNQDFFLGIPYAKPAKRFSVAERLDNHWSGVREATKYPPHCYGYGADNIGYEMSEDCLFLNVVRPSKVSKDAQLPVAVWIHGGGLFMGGSADKRYNLSYIVEQSVQMGKPIMGVSLNYRLVAFGFLGGKEALAAGATNIGFRDQRLAIEWVHENIGAFGGSPDKITIWGESSGAESVTAQVLAYNGQHGGLFRSAIGQSGFGGMIPRLPGGYNVTNLHQKAFDSLVRNISSCAATVGTPKAIECLRKADFVEINQTLSRASTASWPPVLDGDFLTDYSANQISKGKFARVPILIGANSDEGTAFGPGKGPFNTDHDLRQAIQSFISPNAAENTGKPIEDILDQALYLYPNIQSVGIPSLKTWPHVLQRNENSTQQLGLQYRRGNAFFGDVYMQYLRRRANLAWSKYGLPSYAYRFDVTVNGVPAFTGATHFQEVAFVFCNLNGDGYSVNPFGGDWRYTNKAQSLARTMSSMWINFIVDQTPNSRDHHESWPLFNSMDGGGAGRGIVFGVDNMSVELDDWRAEGINWLIENDLGLIGN